MSPSFWDDPKTHSQYFDWLGRELGFKKMGDWYTLSTAQMHSYRGNRSNFVRQLIDLGSSLLRRHYGGSKKIARALMSVYPMMPWTPWLFSSTERDYWASLGIEEGLQYSELQKINTISSIQ